VWPSCIRHFRWRITSRIGGWITQGRSLWLICKVADGIVERTIVRRILFRLGWRILQALWGVASANSVVRAEGCSFDFRRTTPE
jgi:hypothetical protein